MNAGVVRDVPELEVVEGNGHRGMWAEYCDRGYQYDKDFTDSNRPKWYIIGNSFGRDMINVILGSRIADMVELSYSDVHSYQNCLNRFAEADVVILSTLMVDEIKIADVQQNHCSNNKHFFHHWREKFWREQRTSLQFDGGIRETVEWYLKNLVWLDNVTSGDYLTYYEKMYDNR